MIRSIAALYVALSLGGAVPVLANDDDWTMRFGVGGYAGNSPYVGSETTRILSPIASFRWRGFTVGTTGVSYRTGGLELTLNSATFDYSLNERTNFRLGVVYQGAPYTSGSDPQLAGLNRAGWQEAVLGFRSQPTDATELSLDIGRDISGNVNGGEITLAGKTRVALGPLPLDAQIGMNWKSEDMAMYLYGVRASEATGTRAAYSPGASLSPFISLQAAVPLGENVAAISEFRVEALPSNVTSSPIVARSFVGSLSFGVGVQF